MKKVLAVVLAAAFVSLTALGAYAQIPNVQWFFDENLTQTSADCDGSAFNTGYIVAVNFNEFISSVEYTINYPVSGDMTIVGEGSVNALQLNIGNTQTGIASAWALPLNCFQPTVILQVIYSWNSCSNCNPGANKNQSIVADIHPTGRLSYVRWPDNTRFDAIGMTSLVCPGAIPTEETSWGAVKALYDN
jgi:hypothetical protein